MLHLQGYDHEREREARVMERRETQIVTLSATRTRTVSGIRMKREE